MLIADFAGTSCPAMLKAKAIGVPLCKVFYINVLSVNVREWISAYRAFFAQ